MCNVVKNIGAMFAASLVSRPNFSDYGYSASVLYNFLSLSELSAPWYGADLNTSSATDTGAITNVNVRPTPNLSVLTVIMVMTVMVMPVNVTNQREVSPRFSPRFSPLFSPLFKRRSTFRIHASEEDAFTRFSFNEYS